MAPTSVRTLQLLPERLAARVTLHTARAGDAEIPCATWCTEGMAAVGHPELTVTLRRLDASDADSLSLDAIRFFLGVYEAASQGRALGAGTLGEFPAGLFDGGEPHGFVCVHPGSSRDPDAPARGLRVVVLHRDELTLASAYGPRRVLARLARAARVAPFPAWWDAERPSVAHPDDAATLLADAPRVRVLDAAVSRSEDVVTLRLAPSSHEGLRAAVDRVGALLDAVREGHAFALAPTPGSKGLSLVWAEAEALPEAIPAARYLGVEALAGLGARPTVEREAFTLYARAVCAAIDAHFAETWASPGHDLMVHVELHPRRRPSAAVALRPGVAHPTVNGLCARVEAIAAPEVTGPAVFRVEFALWGGAS